MDAEQKAEELVMKYFNIESGLIVEPEDAKQCALIAVEEIISTNKWFFAENYSKTIDTDITKKYSELVNFWYDVKENIQKL